VNDVTNDVAMKYVASTYDYNNNILRDGISFPGKRIITFSNILQHKLFPLAEILNTLLDLGEYEMNNPIEIEFAANLETPPGAPKVFNFLQIRPIVHTDETSVVNLAGINREDAVIWSESALGNGFFKGITDIVYVKPESFNPARNKDIASDIERINNEFVKQGAGYVLIGPGRWGSTDPWLGIPVRWPQISAARIIVESGLKTYRIDPSQGTHFFQNLTSFRVGYFTINPYINEGSYDVEFLNGIKSKYEDEHLRHIRFEKPLEIMVDGKTHRGVIMKPSLQ
jgi:hypothetical protein